MTPAETYKLAATLTAHQLLIRELFVLNFGRLPNPIGAVDMFAANIKPGLQNATVPKIGAAPSDAMTQEIAEVVQNVLDEAKSTLTKLLSGLPPQSPSPNSSPG